MHDTIGLSVHMYSMIVESCFYDSYVPPGYLQVNPILECHGNTNSCLQWNLGKIQLQWQV